MLYRKNLLKLKINLFSLFHSENNNLEYLSFFRICVGLIAVFEIISLHSDLNIFFSEKNAIIPQELNYIFTEYFEYLNPFYNFLKKYELTEFFYSNIINIYITFLFFLVFGFLTRITALLLIFIQLLVFKSFVLFNYGYDHFLTTSFFYCLIFPVGNIHSIDSIFFKKTINITFNYFKVIRIHLILIYFFAGLAKIISLSWWNGIAIWRSLSTIYDDYFKISPYILTIIGIITIIMETFYPLLINFKKTRKFTLFMTIAMHLGIAIFLNLPFFALLMIVWNITAYYDYFSLKKIKLF